MNEKKLVYIVEDEEDILELIAINLSKAGFAPKKFMRSSELQRALKNKIPDIILLDIMLPDIDGIEICKRLKKDEKFSHIPIIMVTAKTDEIDVVLGLEIGADDYILKPFSVRELIARVKAVLRRGNIPEESRRIIRMGNFLEVDPDKFEVRLEGKRIVLTTTEFYILKTFVEKPGWVFSREKLLDILWSDEKDVFDRTIDVHIKNLREKLGSAGKLIKNIRGVGYKIDPGTGND